MNNGSDTDIGFASKNDEWTIECFVDELFLSLAKAEEVITNGKGKTIHVKKYYRRARDIITLVPIRRPPPIFIISILDLPGRVVEEFKVVIDIRIRTYVISQAVGRIFENLDFNYYHLSVARYLRVGFEK